MPPVLAAFLLTAVLGPTPAEHRVNKLLDAMEKVESGGHGQAVRNGGHTRGSLQIPSSYWREGTRAGHVKWDYRDRVVNNEDSRQVAAWYLKKHAPDAYRKGDFETLAKTHKTGTSQPKPAALEKYWSKVKSKLR